MFYRFTPSSVIVVNQKRTISMVLIFSLIISSVYYLFSSGTAVATTTYTWDESNFGGGSFASTTHDTSIGLLPRAIVTDTFNEEFKLGQRRHAGSISDINEDGLNVGNMHYAFKRDLFPVIEGGAEGSYVSVKSGSIMFVGSNGDGVLVLDTRNTADFTDDVYVGQYNTSSGPVALPNLGGYANYIGALFYDEVNHLLYVGTWSSGVSVINTQGTLTDLSDDVLVFNYRTVSNPLIASNDVVHINISGELLFIATYNSGVSVIDRGGTVSAADDIRVGFYRTNTVPVLPSNRVYGTHLDGDYLYLAQQTGGLSIVDTRGTLSTSTDDIVINYSTTTLGVQSVFGVFKSGPHVFFGGGDVLDTKNTATTTDDEFVPYPLIGDGYAWADYYFKQGSETFFVSTDLGDYLIEINQEDDIFDDSLILRTEPGSFWNYYKINNVYYAENEAGIYSFNDDLDYNSSSKYVSDPKDITSDRFGKIVIDADVASNQSGTVYYRTGTSSAVWRDDFDQATSSYVGDYYDWGDEFQDVLLDNGVLTLSNPSSDYGLVVFDTGFSEDYFATGTAVTARVRVNTDELFQDWMFFDNWDNYFAKYYTQKNEWVILNQDYVAPFSKVSFEPWLWDYPFNAWPSSDSWQIDWLQITTPDSMGFWNEWKACPSIDYCEIDQAQLDNNSWMQYRLDLSTTDPSSSPIIHSVTLEGDYAPLGTYTSQTETFAKAQELLIFSVDHTVPTSTTATYEYSVDDGETWSAISAGATFPTGTITKSFTWRTALTSADLAKTPRINSVTLTTAKAGANSSSTIIQQRVDSLEQKGLTEEAAYLRRTFPDVFDENGQATTEEIQYGILIRIEKILDLIEQMQKLKARN